MRRVERRKREKREVSVNCLQRLPARGPINANCGNAFCEEDSCPETGWKPPPHFPEATEQLFGDNSLHLLLTWYRSKLMAKTHPQLPRSLLTVSWMLFTFENSLLISRDAQGWGRGGRQRKRTRCKVRHGEFLQDKKPSERTNWTHPLFSYNLTQCLHSPKIFEPVQ